MLASGFNAKINTKDSVKLRGVLAEQIIKCLLRCRKFMDAKDDIIKIMVFINRREQMINVLEDELFNIQWNDAKTVYLELVRVSFRTYN